MIKMPGVEDYLKTAGHDVKQVKMARAAYLKHFCKRVPPNGLLPDETPKAKWQCTLLPEGVYSESTSVDTSTHLLRKLNDMLSVPVHIKLNDVITMEDVQHKDNVYIRQRIQGYCSLTLGVLVPGEGNAVYKLMQNMQMQTRTKKLQGDVDILVGSLVNLVLLGKHPSDRRLAFVQLCGSLGLKDLNSRLAIPVSRNKYKLGGTLPPHAPSNYSLGIDVYLSFPNQAVVFRYVQVHGALPCKTYLSCLSREVVFEMLNCIKSICSLGWRPYCVMTYFV